MGVEEEAKASGMCDRASEETKNRSRRRSHQRVTKTTPTPEKRRWTNRHREEDEEPRRVAKTAFVAYKLWRHRSQKYTHSKVRKKAAGKGKEKAHATPSRRREEEDTAPLLQKEKSPKTKTVTIREGGLQLKPPRLVTLGERKRRIGRRSKKGNTKSEAQE